LRKISVLLLTGALLAGCGDDDDAGGIANNSPPVEEQLSGVFIDSTVQELSYSSLSHNGKTSNDGRFDYQDGENTTFFIADVILGSTSNQAIITPVELATVDGVLNYNRLINIIRLLQALDADGDPSNGIYLNSTAHTAGIGAVVNFDLPFAEFSNDSDVQSFLAAASLWPLVNLQDALKHLKSSLEDLNPSDSRIALLPAQEIEPNNHTAEALPLTVSGSVVGTLNSSVDVHDYFSFTPPAPNTYSIRLTYKGSENQNPGPVENNDFDLDRAKKSGCLACHSIEKKVVGPAFLDVAERYRSDATARNFLIQKVNTGGKGSWNDVTGGVPMPPYSPRVTHENITRLVDGILSIGANTEDIPTQDSTEPPIATSLTHSIGWIRNTDISHHTREVRQTKSGSHEMIVDMLETTYFYQITALETGDVGVPYLVEITQHTEAQNDAHVDFDFDLAKRSGCLACHSIEKKVVGPAFLDVAERYRSDATARDFLIKKVKTGGKGSWNDVTGGVPMPPYSPRVTHENITHLVDGILSLGSNPSTPR